MCKVRFFVTTLCKSTQLMRAALKLGCSLLFNKLQKDERHSTSY